MAYGFDHAHIKCKDPRKTAKWWADNFGAKLLPEAQSPGGPLFCPIQIGGIKINITTPRPNETTTIAQGNVGPRFGLEHLGITTDNLDADLAKLKAQGLKVFEVHETPALRFAFVETPDNVRIELMQHMK